MSIMCSVSTPADQTHHNPCAVQSSLVKSVAMSAVGSAEIIEFGFLQRAASLLLPARFHRTQRFIRFGHFVAIGEDGEQLKKGLGGD